MFFIVSKILGFFALPSNIILALGFVGVVLLRTRFARAGRALVTASIVLFAAVRAAADRQGADRAAGGSLSAMGCRARRAGRHRGAGWRHRSGIRRGARRADLNEAAERVTVVAELARNYPPARILYSGGIGRLVFRGGSEAEFAAALIETFGVPRSRLILEDQSRNTAENAIFSRQLAAPKPGERWLLVTSGYHMPRVDRGVPQGRIRGRGLSGRLPHPRPRRPPHPVRRRRVRIAPHRHGGARMDRPPGLLARGAQLGAVSGAARAGTRS